MQLLATTPVTEERFAVSSESVIVSESELAFIERLLAIIDARNGVLACISGWFSCWNQTREFCLLYSQSSPETQVAVAARFKKLIENLHRQGKDLVALAVTDVLSIQDDHFKIATGATLIDLGACIAFLDDRLLEFFTEDPEAGSNDKTDKGDNGAISLVSSGL